ncbi:N-alpha-acetyltransferase 50-like [Galendromus occidentalis]|uniref:N-alpha-acetyltransferase 60 n=1 Tax=Galendromus occidentalis TaxID=34638 RepID=A0AAJ6QYE2_9ACAR|nr:N-alpha-acetyltransferase 50-like [Galendromus occidentalis]
MNCHDRRSKTRRGPESKELTKRPMRPGDFSQIKSLMEDIFPMKYPDSYFWDIAAAAYWSLGIFTANDELIAIVVAGKEFHNDRTIHDKPPEFRYLPEKTVYMYSIGTKPPYRRLKLSTILARDCLRMCRERGASAVYLHVMAENLAAIRLYEKLGFKSFAFLAQYYSPYGGDALGKILRFDDKIHSNSECTAK